MRLLAIIPARGGSKGIKDKNIVDVAGKPLLAYTAEPALKLVKEGVIAKLILSTDSEKIAAVGKKLGLEAPFLRPQELASDKAKSIGFVTHALEFYKNKGVAFDAVIILQPTSPLRTAEDIKEAIMLFEKRKGESLISCYQDETLNLNIIYEKAGDYAVPLDQRHNLGTRRQEHEPLCVRNGAVYIVSAAYALRTGTIVSEKPLLYLMPKSRSVNIDTAEDLETIRKLLGGRP